MSRDDQTTMGGGQVRFLTTHWSLIETVDSDEKDGNRALIGSLLKQYWKPVYCYLRRHGYGNEEAKDLTQDFFHEVVLGRGLFQRADQSQGRFRPFKPVAESPNPPTDQELMNSDLSDLASCLARILQKYPDLARLIKAWPELPVAIRSPSSILNAQRASLFWERDQARVSWPLS